MFRTIYNSIRNVTWKTILRTFLVMLIATFISYLLLQLMEYIVDNINEENERLNNMIKVIEPETLEYCINTQQNEFLIRGNAMANEPVSLPELKGKFSAIRKIKYHYESHIETYTVTVSDGNGKSHVETRTKVVWDWERKGYEDYKTNTVYLLGKNFDLLNTSYSYQSIDFSDYSNKDKSNWKDGYYNYEDSNTRYKYEIVPISYDTTFVSNYKLILQKRLGNQTIEQVTEIKDTTYINIIFYIIILIIIILSIIILIYWEEIFYHSNFLCD